MLAFWLFGVLLLLLHLREVDRHTALDAQSNITEFIRKECVRMIEDRDLYILFLENEPRSKK